MHPTSRQIVAELNASQVEMDALKRLQAGTTAELPRIPFAPDFRAFAKAGKKLADLHVGYEQAKEYPLSAARIPRLRSIGASKR